MKIFRKCDLVRTEEEAVELLAAQDAFINNPQPGDIPPRLTPELWSIWNSGDVLGWGWEEESLPDKVRRKAKEQAEADELEKLQTDSNYFKATKIRPWRDSKLVEWVDDTFLKPLKYNLTGDQITERAALHVELCDWPDLFDEYKTDEEIDALKPSAPSWITE